MTGSLGQNDGNLRGNSDDPFYLFKKRARVGLPLITLIPAVPFVAIGIASLCTGTFKAGLLIPLICGIFSITLTIIGLIRQNLRFCTAACLLMYGGMVLYGLASNNMG